MKHLTTRHTSPFLLQFFLALLGFILLCSGCAQPDKTNPQEPVITESRHNNVDEEADHGCSYFYFLWGRHSELTGKNEAALEAYQKAIICDSKADYVVRKIPLLLLRLNRTDEAIAILKDYLDRYPQDSDSRMLLAKIFIRQGEFAEAASQYRKVHQLTPDDPDPLLLLSELYIADGKSELARDALEDVLKIDSQSYSAHLLLARLLIAEQQFDRGQEHYKQALLSNWSPELELEMAEGYLQEKKYNKAIKLYQNLLDRDELNEDARIALIQVYLLQKDEKRALAELKQLKAISKHPDQIDLTIVRIYARWEEYDKAITILTDILQKKEVSEARYLLALLHFQKKEYLETLEDLQGMSRTAEEYADAVFLQVRALRELRQNEKAIELLESAIGEEEGRSPDMYVLLASLYQLVGREDLGRETFLRSLAAYPDNEDLFYEYAQFLDYAGDPKQAMEVMQQVIKLQPDHAGALNYVGYTWAEQNINLDKAFVYISRAVDLKPDNGYIRDSLGWVYFQQGKLEEALKAMQQAVELSPDDPAVLDHLGDVQRAAGQNAAALKSYQKAVQLYEEQDKAAAETDEEDDPGSRVQKEREDKIRQGLEKKIRLLEEQETR
jgi:tetratricopeptide (TPR) repeat protein